MWNTVFRKESSEDRGIVQLTPMGEKTLRFVSGYVSYSLREKYKKTKEGSTFKEKLRVIKSWDANREENLTGCGLMENKKEWVEKFNQGGLFEVNVSFYMFKREVEILGRDYLNTELIRIYQGEDLKAALIKKFDESKKSNIGWSSLTHYIENFELKDFLKNEVLKNGFIFVALLF